MEYYNHQRYHEALKNIIPAKVNIGRNNILTQRKEVKQKTLQARKAYKRKLRELNKDNSTG